MIFDQFQLLIVSNNLSKHPRFQPSCVCVCVDFWPVVDDQTVLLDCPIDFTLLQFFAQLSFWWGFNFRSLFSFNNSRILPFIRFFSSPFQICLSIVFIPSYRSTIDYTSCLYLGFFFSSNTLAIVCPLNRSTHTDTFINSSHMQLSVWSRYRLSVSRLDSKVAKMTLWITHDKRTRKQNSKNEKKRKTNHVEILF